MPPSRSSPRARATTSRARTNVRRAAAGGTGMAVGGLPVAHERRPDDFGRRSVRVFDKTHSIADELGWLESEGPASPALVKYVERAAPEFDFVVLFSARYYHTWHLARR